MANNKNDINDQLNSLTNIASGYAKETLETITEKSQGIKSGLENLSEDLASIYDPQAVQDGIKTIAKKMENIPDGASLTQISEGVPGLTIPDNLTSKKLTINGVEKTVGEHMTDLLGAITPKKKLNFEALGGESLKGINDAITTGVAKLKNLKVDIINSISEVSDSAGNSLANITSDVEFSSIEGLIKSSGNVTRGITVNDIKNAAQSQNPLEGLVSGIDKAVTDLFNTSSNLSINTGGGLVQDVGESISRTNSTRINSLINDFPFTDSKLSQLIQKSKGTPTEKAEAVKDILLNDENLSGDMKKIIEGTKNSKSPRELSDKVANLSRARGLPESEVTTVLNRLTKIEVVVNSIDTTISGTIQKSNADYFVDEKDLSNLTNKFEFVDSIEELIGEFKVLTRDVTECIIHSSNTFTNQNIGSREIDDSHKEDGYDGIQFHYVIRRDGRIQRGKPVNERSLASKVNGHEDYTIDICLIGGINAPTGTENAENYLSERSYTIEQWRSLNIFLASFYNKFPGGIVMGYGDIDNGYTEPYFNVIEYVDVKFKKYNPYRTPSSDKPLKSSEITQTRVEII